MSTALPIKKTIVCFGDSNTHGYQAATGGRFDDTERFPRLLEQYLGSDYLVLEEGMSGRTTVFEDPLFEGLSGISSIFSCLMSHEPIDLFLIMLGTNDTKERFGVNGENIAKGLERLTQKCLSTKAAFRNGKPNILLVAPAPIEEGYRCTPVYHEMGNGCVEKSQQLAFYYKQTAAALGCGFFDAGTIPGIKMHPNDHMHLDKTSHQLLAKALCRIIPTLL